MKKIYLFLVLFVSCAVSTHQEKSVEGISLMSAEEHPATYFPEVDFRLGSPGFAVAQKNASVPYDCSAYPELRVPLVEKTNDVLDALVATWLRDLRLKDVQRSEIEKLLPYLSDISVERLSDKERIIAQHSLLHFAQGTSGAQRKQLASVAMRFALPPNSFLRIGSALEPTISWMGEWRDRHREGFGDMILAHEKNISEGLLHFRPIEFSDRRALVAQMIAFDSLGEPHVTPVVAFVEFREGFSVNAPACVLELSLSQLRSDAPSGLRAVAYEEFSSGSGCAFVSQSTDGGMGCRNCHSTGSEFSGFTTVALSEVNEWRATRERSILSHSRNVFRWLQIPGVENWDSLVTVVNGLFW